MTCVPISARFRTNKGIQYAHLGCKNGCVTEQAPFKVDWNTYVFGLQEQQYFKMASVDRHGNSVEERFTWKTEVPDITQLTAAKWNSATVLSDNLFVKTKYKVDTIKTGNCGLIMTCDGKLTTEDHVCSYTCANAAGYIGTHGEVDYDECLSSPCLNGGTVLGCSLHGGGKRSARSSCKTWYESARACGIQSCHKSCHKLARFRTRFFKTLQNAARSARIRRARKMVSALWNVYGTRLVPPPTSRVPSTILWAENISCEPDGFEFTHRAMKCFFGSIRKQRAHRTCQNSPLSPLSGFVLQLLYQCQADSPAVRNILRWAKFSVDPLPMDPQKHLTKPTFPRHNSGL